MEKKKSSQTHNPSGETNFLSLHTTLFHCTTKYPIFVSTISSTISIWNLILTFLKIYVNNTMRVEGYYEKLNLPEQAISQGVV